ncbi:MAG: noncanonical pyrimidine nucleotidase, YjjG family [Marinilabiliales bacterium]|nr:MAG: noncanonical pyrimidine nucleotidase, YjjG family [Marinilabiliales bacterium]
MQSKYKHIFFDLDRTLWDFETSALEAFEIIHDKYKLTEIGVESGKQFHDAYTFHNEKLWNLYRVGEISKEILKGKRFHLTLQEFGVSDKNLAEKIGDEYTTISPKLVNLFPNSIEILEYLFDKYPLHIITNGFSEVQAVKLKSSGMDKYFQEVITSEDAGVKKPDLRIFKYALERAKATSGESLMIGDDYEVDIVGAQNVGLDQVYFNPLKQQNNNGCTFEIENLIELKEIL